MPRRTPSTHLRAWARHLALHPTGHVAALLLAGGAGAALALLERAA